MQRAGRQEESEVKGVVYAACVFIYTCAHVRHVLFPCFHASVCVCFLMCVHTCDMGIRCCVPSHICVLVYHALCVFHM